eukprot:COSAG01_NODE_3004_length_6735_cov_44.599759_10_plen_76_part_00
MLDYWPGFSYQGMMLFRAVMVTAQLLVVAFLADPRLPEGEKAGKGLGEQVRVVWSSMHENRVWRPMVFICTTSAS